MTQITVSIDSDLEKRLRKFAEDNDYNTLSALVTDAIRDKIDNTTPDYWQRVGMVLQLENKRLLEMLVGEKAQLRKALWNTDAIQDALMGGYTIDYRYLFGRVERNELADDEARNVHDTLGAFYDLLQSAEHIGDKNLIKKVQFPGFDAKNDYKKLNYANYIIRRGIWSKLAVNGEIPNSHGEQGDYKKIVARLKEVQNKIPRQSDRRVFLSRDDILYIIDGTS